MIEPLDATEVRVLGALVEKELSTPDYYPMTVNALTNACNQKTNRDPVVNYSEEQVRQTLDTLQRERLVGTASSSYGRKVKYRHTFAERFDLTEPERAVLCSLMLRGPETVGEIRGRTSRMHPFEDLEDVEAVLTSLRNREWPLVTLLPRQPGQKERRYMHLLAGEPAAEPAEEAPAAPSRGDRLDQLEAEVDALREELQSLEAAFTAFREQFE